MSKWRFRSVWRYISHIDTISGIGQQITLPILISMVSIGVTGGIGLWQEYQPLIIWFAILFCIPLSFYISDIIKSKLDKKVILESEPKDSMDTLLKSVADRDRQYLSSFVVVTESNFDLTHVTGEGGFITFNFWIFNGTIFTIRIKNENTGRIICDNNPQPNLPDLRGGVEKRHLPHGYNQRIEIRQFISSSLGQHLMMSKYVCKCLLDEVRFPLEIIDDSNPIPNGPEHYLKLKDITIQRNS